MKLEACLLTALSTFFCASPQQPDPTIRVNVNLIQLDATVTDRSGRRVPDLTAADFEVSREGKRQSIKSVVWVPGQRPKLAPAVPVPPASAITGELRPEDIRRTIVIMLDDLNLSLSSMSLTREAMKKFVQENMDTQDLVAVCRSSRGLSAMQQFTTNKRLLLASIERMNFASMVALDPLAPISISPLESSDDSTIARMAREARQHEDIQNRSMQDMRTAAMLGSVNLAVLGLRELPGRKALVLVSDGVQLLDMPSSFNDSNLDPLKQRPGAMGGKRNRTDAALRSLIDMANRSGVMISTIDPRGLVNFGISAQDSVSAKDGRLAFTLAAQWQQDFQLSQDGLDELARETGGVFYRNSNDIIGALRSALDDQEGYYLVAFEPDDATFEKAKGEPKFQHLTVKVKRSGTSVRYRRGFYNVPDQETTAMNPLVSAVLSPFRAARIPTRITPVFMHNDATGPYLRALVHIDAANLQFTEVAADAADQDQQPWQQATLNELVVLFDETGRVVQQVANPQVIKARGASFALLKREGVEQTVDVAIPKPGPYQMRVAVMDVMSKAIGSSAQFAEVPDLKNKRLALSGVVLSSTAWTASQDAAGSPSRRVMRPGAEFGYALSIYNAVRTRETSRPNLLTQLRVFQEGKLIFTGKKNAMQPENLKENDALILKGKLRLEAPGDYVLEVAVQDLGAARPQFALRYIDFTVSQQ